MSNSEAGSLQNKADGKTVTSPKNPASYLLLIFLKIVLGVPCAKAFPSLMIRTSSEKPKASSLSCVAVIQLILFNLRYS